MVVDGENDGNHVVDKPLGTFSLELGCFHLFVPLPNTLLERNLNSVLGSPLLSRHPKVPIAALCRKCGS